jgi:hypothetical protein
MSAEYIATRKEPQRFEDLINAIQLLYKMEADPEYLPAGWRETLLKFPGFGSISTMLDYGNKSRTAQDWRDKFQELVDEKEHASAMRAAVNQFHTHPYLIPVLWKVARHFGFNRGSVLEPGCSLGLFFEYAPEDLSCSFAGIERDLLTARIAKKLWPPSQQHRIIDQDIKQARLPFGHFNLVIGNPPFENGVSTSYGKEGFSVSLQTWIVCRAVEWLKPGGLAVLLVGTGFMDNHGEQSTKARQWVQERASLIAAMRLPMNVVGGANGSEVCSDLIILQKKPRNPAFRANDFRYSEPHPSITSKRKGEEGKPVHLNNYFLANPADMIGTVCVDRLTGARIATDLGGMTVQDVCDRVLALLDIE